MILFSLFRQDVEKMAEETNQIWRPPDEGDGFDQQKISPRSSMKGLMSGLQAQLGE